MRSKLVIITFLIVWLYSFIAYIPKAAASVSLVNVGDTASTTYPSASSVEHEFNFTVPASGSDINTNNYIFVKIPHFTEISIAQISVSGQFVYGKNPNGSTGTLQASLSGSTITLSNLSIIAGAHLQIDGIVAKNPNGYEQENEEIDVSQNAQGTQLIYQSTFMESVGDTAVNASATLKPYTASVQLSGFASPTFFITIAEGASVVGTVTSDGLGYFSSTLTGVPPGLHTYTIYGTDNSNNQTAQTTVILYAPIYITTIYNNIVLSPIISLSATQVHQSDPLTFSGETVPNSNVTISINSPLIQFNTTSDANGNFSYTDTSVASMTPGQYLASATVQTDSSLESVSSIAQTFTVLSNNTGNGNGQQPSCDISHGDLNCDRTVDIFDFSILLYYWGTNSALADINKDGNVDLFDFSIMMYYFSV